MIRAPPRHCGERRCERIMTEVEKPGAVLRDNTGFQNILRLLRGPFLDDAADWRIIIWCPGRIGGEANAFLLESNN